MSSALRRRLPAFDRMRRLRTAARLAYSRERHARARLECYVHDESEDARGLVAFFKARANLWQDWRLRLERTLEDVEAFDPWFVDEEEEARALEEWRENASAKDRGGDGC